MINFFGTIGKTKKVWERPNLEVGLSPIALIQPNLIGFSACL